MLVTVLKSKLHRVKVTEANLNYVGSITIDEELMEEAGININEKIEVVDINNGNRWETYAIPGKRKSGIISLNGGGARLGHPGDLLVIMSYGLFDEKELSFFKPKILFVDSDNKIINIKDGEEHGMVK